MSKYLGILTAGGDSPGLNAAIRAVGKASLGSYKMKMVGFREGFRGLVHNRTVKLDDYSPNPLFYKIYLSVKSGTEQQHVNLSLIFILSISVLISG